jgi:hypothetical protein
LLEIRLANYSPGLFPDALQSRHEYRQQQGDDRDNDQKLNQCKSSLNTHDCSPSQLRKVPSTKLFSFGYDDTPDVHRP